MKEVFILAIVLMIFVCSSGYSSAQGSHERVWLNPVRYEIVILKPGSREWPAGFNEVILLDSESGRTWTLRSKKLIDGWVLMPRTDQPEK